MDDKSKNDGFNADFDEIFESIPEGTRIIISGKTVTFENMTPELAQIASALTGDDTPPTAKAKKNISNSSME